MRAVYVVAVVFLSSLASAMDRDCRLECFHAAVSYRNLKKENVPEGEMEKPMTEECEIFAKKLYYPCSKAVKLILGNDEIKNTIENWNVDVPSDTATEKKVKKYCWKACRNRREN
ncbi:hypothetical protein Aduo_000774 [Ancylostoma duodenale]